MGRRKFSAHRRAQRYESLALLARDSHASVAQLAERTGLLHVTLWRVFNGLREPKAFMLRKIARGLGCTTDALIEELAQLHGRVKAQKLKDKEDSKRKEEC